MDVFAQLWQLEFSHANGLPDSSSVLLRDLCGSLEFFDSKPQRTQRYTEEKIS
jgi:hypothetical protein